MKSSCIYPSGAFRIPAESCPVCGSDDTRIDNYWTLNGKMMPSVQFLECNSCSKTMKRTIEISGWEEDMGR